MPISVLSRPTAVPRKKREPRTRRKVAEKCDPSPLLSRPPSRVPVIKVSLGSGGMDDAFKEWTFESIKASGFGLELGSGFSTQLKWGVDTTWYTCGPRLELLEKWFPGTGRRILWELGRSVFSIATPQFQRQLWERYWTPEDEVTDWHEGHHFNFPSWSVDPSKGLIDDRAPKTIRDILRELEELPSGSLGELTFPSAIINWWDNRPPAISKSPSLVEGRKYYGWHEPEKTDQGTSITYYLMDEFYRDCAEGAFDHHGHDPFEQVCSFLGKDHFNDLTRRAKLTDKLLTRISHDHY